MGNPHILAIPYPAQGHVIPLLELCQCLVKHGCEVTFVNTDYNHQRVTSALLDDDCIGDNIQLASLPDGMEPGEDRNKLGMLSEAIIRVMPRKLEELLENMIQQRGGKITCVIADGSLAWALEVADKMKIRRVAFWPAAAAMLALCFSIPKLIDDGVLDYDGTPTKSEAIQLAPTTPPMKAENLVWTCIGDKATQKIIFEMAARNNLCRKLADWVICNTVQDLEPGALNLFTEIIPIGPLIASNRLGHTTGNFWQEDLTCLKWLNKQPPCSVIYVAFGSFTILNQVQFQELALGLELCNKPFLWVVRPDVAETANEAYPEGFLERIASRGKMVSWAPQQKVLGHPSIGCFLSHCGWNSTIESVSNGVPLLCWPYFADQFFNESYICDFWKVGFPLNKDENGIISRTEIKSKVEKLMGDEELKARACKIKETVKSSIGEANGSSYKNLMNFIDWLRT